MIRSMTGYASVRSEVGSSFPRCEIKSLNHRGFDFHFYSSRSLAMLEVPARELIQKQIKRGRTEIYLRGEPQPGMETMVTVRPDLAARYLQSITAVQQRFPQLGSVGVEFLLNLPGVFEIEEPVLSPEDLWHSLRGVVEQGLAELIAMKMREGENLKRELIQVLSEVESLSMEISGARDAVLREYREKMTERVREWLHDIQLDEGRVIQEIAYYADRSDIQEECVRMSSHVDQFRALLEENQAQPDTYIAVGRRMDFLCQEMFREANTMGSKSSSTEVIQRVLRLKGQIDRLREQVQNVE
jgi:uncharacterized protein (TIGR00255 family)